MSNTENNDIWEEDRLVSGLKQGHEEAFQVLVRRYQARLFGVAFGMTQDREESQDIVQDVDGAGNITQSTIDLPLMESTNLTTRVLVPDRGTVMLGGLTLTAETEVESGVPVLSKIPIIGRLFSNRSEVKDKHILLILVKPTIILKEEAEEDAIAALK